jgi:hypothetical protein
MSPDRLTGSGSVWFDFLGELCALCGEAFDLIPEIQKR